MDFTFNAALSSLTFAEHLSFLLLVCACMMRNISALRLLIVASALVAIVYNAIFAEQPISLFWYGVLLAVNVWQLSSVYWNEYSATFSDVEAKLVDNCLPGLTKGRSKKFLQAGRWQNLRAGTELTRQGEATGYLYFIANGEAEIIVDQVQVARSYAGSFIGEITVLNRKPATATTALTKDSHVWKIAADKLINIIATEPEIGREIEASFARNYRDKIINFNTKAVQEAAE